MMRTSILAILVLGFAATPAEADCQATCGDVCYAADDSAFFRAEVVSTVSGYSSRLKVVERLGGASTVNLAIGNELDEVYSQVEVVTGDHVFVTVSLHTDTAESYAWGVAWPIRDERVICDAHDPTVPLAQYVAMATSNDCMGISEQLDIVNTCDDDVDGCAAAGGSSSALAALLVGLCIRRRRSRV